MRKINNPGRSHKADDLQRVLEIPLVGEADAELVDLVSREFLTPRAYQDGFRFLAKQAEGLATFLSQGSMFGAIGVGHGKTGLSLAIAGAAPFQFPDVKRTMLFVPPNLVPQLKKDLRFWVPRLKRKPHYVPYAGQPKAKRQRICSTAPKGMYAAQYSLISTQDFEEELESINPDLLIFDECHNVRDFSRPKGARIKRYIDNRAKQGRPVRVVAMSGTITNSQIKDYWHFLQWIAGDKCPVPRHWELFKLWDSVIRSERKDSNPFAFGEGANTEQLQQQWVYPLVSWANDRVLPKDRQLTHDRVGVWNAYRLRLVLSPHVTATTDDEIGVSLNFARASELKPLPEGVDTYWREVLDSVAPVPTDERKPDPDGSPYIPELLATPMHRHAYFKQMSAGFFYWHSWPEGLDQETLELCREWKLARQALNKAMGAFLKEEARPGLDSPFLVGDSMRRHGFDDTGDPHLLACWQEFKKRDVELQARGVEQIKNTCWLSEHKVDEIMDWVLSVEAGKTPGGVIFVHSRALGERVAEKIREKLGNGRCIRALGGDNAASEIIEERNRDKYVVGSYGSISDGLNLQFHQHCLFAQLAPSARSLQQAIGRLHRNGQRSDELTMTFSLSTEFEEAELWSLLQDSAYAASTTPQAYKALAGRYLFDLTEAPASFLRAMGFQRSELPERERAALAERFGWA